MRLPSAIRRHSVLLAVAAVASAARAETVDPLAFSRAVSFTVSGYDGESTLENFPVLVRLSTKIAGFSYEDIGSTTNAAYASLRFADADRRNLDYEIEEWDPSGTSFVWVSLPELAGTNTEFRAFYSPDAGTVLPDVHPTNVWTGAGYVGVWHLSAIVKNHAGGYQAYDDHLWGHVFPDSTGRGANATKGTTGWDTSLMNVPHDANGFHFPESLGRANGTLGANAYTPSIVPPTAAGGGAGDWTFSATGYSSEAWVFPFGTSHNILISGQSAGDGSDGFVYAATNGIRLCANDWGGSATSWGADDAGERSWHFVTAVWTPAGASDPSALYGSTGDAAPALLVSRSGKHATDQFATEGMRFAGGTGIEFGLDEIRVRRGLSTPDWIQANWDAQRVGTDFLEYGVVRKPRDPAVTAVAATSATVSCDFSFAGGDYAGGTVRAVFVAFPSFATNAVAVPNPARPSARATGLSPDTDYTVRFVVERDGAVVYETSATAFVTAGRPTIRPHRYRRSVTFAATGYDGGETLEHFPVLVHLSEATVPGFGYDGVDPAEIRFATADGALLAHEVETWDPDGLSTVWVALPSLAGTNTAFTMHWKPYERAGVPAQPVHRVWHYAGYECVWHLNERLGDDETHYEYWDERPFALYYADSSGHGRHATKGTTCGSSPGKTWRTSLAQTSPTNGPAPVSANGSPALETMIPLIVPPTVSGGMDFSSSGYSAEAWFNPERGGGQGLFLTGNGVPNSTNSLFADNRSVGALSCSWNMRLNPGGGNSRPSYTGASGYTGTNVWHFLTANWAPAGSTTPTAVYAGNPTVPAAFRGFNYSDTAVAPDLSATGIGLTGSVGASSGGSDRRFVDELRIRRGLSTPDWIQANWDTQRLGTDFLSAGPVVDHLLPTVLLLR